jgi:hypothetical protein
MTKLSVYIIKFATLRNAPEAKSDVLKAALSVNVSEPRVITSTPDV